MILDEQYIWDKLINYGIATEEELNLATNLCGYSLKTLDDVLYIKTGYRNIRQYEMSEFSGEYEEEGE